MTNCPNCGAPIVSSSCEYCGTRFDNTYERIIIQQTMDTLQSAIQAEQLYKEALAAMRAYRKGV